MCVFNTINLGKSSERYEWEELKTEETRKSKESDEKQEEGELSQEVDENSINSPYDAFKLLMTDDIIQYIVKETNKYARSRKTKAMPSRKL